jgi:hypothetical protein
MTTSGAQALIINGIDRDLAITPDGSHVVYVGNNGTQLFVRALEPWNRWRLRAAHPADRSSRPTASGSIDQGRELFYRDFTGAMMAASVTPRAHVRSGAGGQAV